MTNEELIARIKDGDQECMGELWRNVERLVSWKAKRVITALNGLGGAEFEDLYNSGFLALCDAVDRYDPEKGNFLRLFIMRLKAYFADATGYRLKRQANDPLRNAVSLNAPIPNECEDLELMDVVADPEGQLWQESVEDRIWRKQLQKTLGEALDTLPEQLREVLRQRYWDNLTLEAIGDIAGITRERVRQMEMEAIHKLQRPSIASKLYSFWDFNFYAGTGLSSYRHSWESVQERYLFIQEERRRRESRRFKEDVERHRREFEAMQESIGR